jgi:site-specific recombinase XerD
MKPEETLISEAVAEWIEYNRQFTRETPRFYRLVITRFVKTLPEGIEKISQLRNEYIEGFVESVTGRYAPKTVEKNRRSLRVFHHWLAKQYGIEDVIPKPKPIPVLKAGEINVVAAWIDYCQKSKETPNKKLFFNFVESLPEGVEVINQLRNEFVENYLESIAGRYPPGTLNNYRYHLRTFHHWLSRQFGIKDIILRKLPKPRTVKPKPKKPIPVLKADDGSNVVIAWIDYCRKFKKQMNRMLIFNFVESLSPGIERIDQLRNEFIESYISSIANEYAKCTLETYRNYLRYFHRWLSKQYGIKDVIPPKSKPIPKPKPKPKPIPVLRAADGTKVCENWFLYIQGLSIETQRYYKRYVINFLEYISKEYVNEITQIDILSYINKFSGVRKNSTTNKNLTVLKILFRWISETYNMPNITAGIRKLKEEMPYQPFINHEQYLKVLESATQRESDIIKMLANTGLRASELGGLRPEYIVPNLSSMRIQGKGGKIRTIPCNQIVREILSRTTDFPKNRKTVYSVCQRAGKRVDVHLAPHMLRRYFASQLINKGVSLLIVSRLLGHSSVQTTEIYLRLSDDDLKGCTEVLAE